MADEIFPNDQHNTAQATWHYKFIRKQALCVSRFHTHKRIQTAKRETQMHLCVHIANVSGMPLRVKKKGKKEK